ncbi:MAG: type 1 glutamine amidotransferase-like domain-containing protein [Thaumarchaeota archaeon]|nr:type 1 glutamine amidotransferase-like domain-containing protein [Nitrososphaerota archaeon]
MKWWRIQFKKDGGETYSNAYRLVNNLVEAGFKVGRVVKLRSSRDTHLKPGDFVIGVEDDYSECLMKDLGEEYSVELKPLKNVEHQSVSWLHVPLIGLYSGNGVSVSYLKETVETLFNMGFRRISLLPGPLTPEDLRAIDVLIVGGGDSFEILRSLGKDEARNIRQFVESGGLYIGICAGALLLLKPVNLPVSAYGEIEAWNELQMVDCELVSDMVSEPSWPVFSGRRLSGILRTYPVTGLVKSRITRRGMLTLGYRGELTMFHTGPFVKIASAKQVYAKIMLPLNSVEYGIPCEEALETMEGASSIAFTEHGSGKIVLFFSHVESRRTPFTHGLLGNAVLLKAYLSGEKVSMPSVEAMEQETLREASESCRMLKLIRDSASKVVDQMESVVPWLYAARLPDRAIRLSILKQALASILEEEDVVLSSVSESVEAEKLLQELRRKKPALFQTTVLSNNLAEWKYVISKTRKALTPILERIMKIQEMMADFSATVVSSPGEEIESKFDLLFNSIVGGRMVSGKTMIVSPGIVSPMLSIMLNIQDFLEKTRFLRKIITYVQP